MKEMKKTLILLGALITVPFLIYFTLIAFSYFEGSDLAVSGDKTPSRYIFDFENHPIVHIDDEFNQFARSWGGSPVKIELENGIRVVTFRGSAILKTLVDSIEPHEEYVKVKGYMGVITEDKKFSVSSDGIISSSKWSGL